MVQKWSFPQTLTHIAIAISVKIIAVWLAVLCRHSSNFSLQLWFNFNYIFVPKHLILFFEGDPVGVSPPSTSWLQDCFLCRLLLYHYYYLDESTSCFDKKNVRKWWKYQRKLKMTPSNVKDIQVAVTEEWRDLFTSKKMESNNSDFLFPENVFK